MVRNGSKKGKGLQLTRDATTTKGPIKQRGASQPALHSLVLDSVAAPSSMLTRSGAYVRQRTSIKNRMKVCTVPTSTDTA